MMVDKGTDTKPKKYILAKEEYKQIFFELVDKYPQLFIRNKPLLLKIGIHQDIVADGKISINKTKLSKFFYVYCKKKEYGKLHVKGGVRYNLKGEESGFVTKEQCIKRNLEMRRAMRKPNKTFQGKENLQQKTVNKSMFTTKLGLKRKDT